MASLLIRPWTLLSEGARDLRNPPEGNRPVLDILRTLAIALVVACHLQGSFPNATLTLRSPVVRFGWSGVDLFCVLSGLLIGGQLWKELKRSGTIDGVRFILRRGFRIWPLYYAIILFLLLEHWFLHTDRSGLWLDATFLSNYYAHFPIGHHQVAGGWSLSLEEQFYLLTPILFILAAKVIPPRSLLAVVIAWFLALPVIRHFVLHGMHDYAQRYDAVYYPFHTHSDSLAVGLVIAWILNWKPEMLKKGIWLDLLMVAVFFGCFALWYRVSLTFLFTAVALAYGALTFLMLRWRVPSWFPSRFFYVISRLSFGIYLIHPGVFAHAMALHTRYFGQGFRGYALAFFIWGAVCVAIAFVTFSLIELPFLKLRDRLLHKNRVADAGLGNVPAVAG